MAPYQCKVTTHICGKSANWGFPIPGDKTVDRCGDHKNEGVCESNPKLERVNKGQTQCIECSKINNWVRSSATYGDPAIKTKAGNIKGTHCARHKPRKFESIKGKDCQYEGCNTTANYSVLGKSPSTHCANKDHWGGLQMFHTTSPKCLYSNGEFSCGKNAIYGLVGEVKPLYCANKEHIPEHLRGKGILEDKKSKKCEHEGCRVQPSYGYRGDKTGTYCATCYHKHYSHLDLVRCRNPCQFEGCKETDVKFGYMPGNKRTHCITHKGDRVNVSEKLKTKDTKEMDTETAEIVKKKCNICDLSNTDYTCKSCSKELNSRRPEDIVKNHLIKTIRMPFASHDKIIDAVCTSERPDFYYDCGTHSVIIEVDEKQHRDKKYKCECTRMSRLYSTIGMKEMVLIRFNPHSFKVEGEKQTVGPEERLKVLSDMVTKSIERKPPSNLFMIQLFYDGRDVQTEDISQMVDI